MALLHPIFLRPFRHLLSLLLGLLLAIPLAQAEGVVLSHLAATRVDGALELSFSSRFELPPGAADALHKGVPIYFVAEASLWRPRWYWRDARVARESRSWRLAWQPLTRQYRVSTGGLHRSYASLGEALSSLRGVAGWRVAESGEMEEGQSHYLEFSYRLDTSQLPRPMQIGLGSPQGWALGVERRLRIEPEAGGAADSSPS